MRTWMRIIFCISVAVICIVVLLAACNKESQKAKAGQENVPPQHSEYLEAFDWHIDSAKSEGVQLIKYAPELMDSLQQAGLDLTPYTGKELRAFTYLLKEKQAGGEEVYATIYEGEDGIVGGYGGLENWTPGLFPLADKAKMLDGELIR